MLNFKHFKKTSSDDDKTTLTHRDGHSITVAHKALSKDLKAKIDALPLAEGGMINKEAGKDLEAHHKQSAGRESFANGGQMGLMPGEPQVKLSSSIYDEAPSEPIPPVSPEEQPSIDPSLQTKRSLYNSIVSQPGIGGVTDFLSGTPTEVDKSQQFGPNGEAPTSFNAQAWNVAEQNYNKQQSQDVAQNSIAIAKAMEDNKARISAGLAPMPVPEGQAPKEDQTQRQTASGPEKMPQSQQAQSDMGNQASQGIFNKGVNQELAGIDQQAAAISQQGAKETQILEKSIQEREEIKNKFNQHIADNETEYNNFIKDVQDQHIDPQHYFASQGTAGKVGTIIGLILGGLSGSDAPSKFLDQQIDRDIETQKMEMNKRNNLVSANMHRFNNIKDAMNMATAMQAGVVMNQLDKAAAEAKSPMAKAAALQAKGRLYMEKVVPNIQKVGLSQGIQQALSGAQSDPNKIQNVIMAIRQSDPKLAHDLQQRLVPGVGLANDEKDATYLKEVQERRKNIQTAVDQAILMIKDKGTYEALGPHNDNLNRLADQIATDMAKLQDPNSVARPGEVELVKKTLVESGLGQQNQTALDKLNKFKGEVDRRANTAFVTRGIKPPAGSISSGGVAGNGFKPKTTKPSK